MVGLGPLLGDLEVGVDGFLFGVGAPGDAGEIGGGWGPLCALVGEFHGGVVVDGGDEVVVVGGKFEFAQEVEAVPGGGADDDVARGVGFADDGEAVLDEGVPGGDVELLVGFVEHFEEDGVGLVLVAFADLLPEGEEFGFVGGEVGGHGVVVVLVEDDGEVVGEGVFEDPVEGGEPGGGELVVGVHVAEGLEVDADGLEAAVVDGGEVFFFEAGVGGVAAEGVVAEDVDAALHGSDLVEGIGRGVKGVWGASMVVGADICGEGAGGR